MTENHDDIFASTPQENPAQESQPSQEFDKEEWAAKKQQERDGVYAQADSMAEKVAAEPQAFKQYLDTQAQFDRYTPTNALLVQAQQPDATRTGDLEYWKSQKVYIKKAEIRNPILILEPGSQYQRGDGSVGTSFDVKRVFDVSQAEKRVAVQKMNYTERALLTALREASPVPIVMSDSLPGNRGAMYDKTSDTILLRQGMSSADIFRAVSREIATIQLSQGEPVPNMPFKALAASYLVCKKYGIEVDNYNFSQSGAVLEGKDAKEVRGELSQIRNAASDTIGKMEQSLAQARNAASKTDRKRDEK